MKTFKSEFDCHIEVHKLTKIAPTSDLPTTRCITLPIQNSDQDAFLSGQPSTYLGSNLPDYIIGVSEMTCTQLVKQVSVDDFGSIDVMIGNLTYAGVSMMVAFTARPEYLRRTLHESHKTAKLVMVSSRPPSEFFVAYA
ncbi:hypothetical protein EC957_002026 [Mortierella hygrophila]|uniref:Uncharacterized protein n=1 Tax=Mortierella hygrophila TaxID=979708 RepID=A0A9P6FGF3_9FUNG|nr:hypothetical protein EC957_002026 [Mortierella hygrophila]